LVVVIRLVVDLDDRLGFPDGVEVFQCVAGGVAGIVPALECSDDDRVIQLGQFESCVRRGHQFSVRRLLTR
jgi:hypothetical protein